MSAEQSKELIDRQYNDGVTSLSSSQLVSSALVIFISLCPADKVHTETFL